ncbi:tRNA pseudouridine(55) synthase TruB [soil metagenome]
MSRFAAPGEGSVLLVDKPAGPTSHDVVDRVRRCFGLRRVGHTGTLDPFATGLLLICLGPATRLSEYLTGLDKRYLATLLLGASTDTDDATGIVVQSSETWRELGVEQVAAALDSQVGAITQLPPTYSSKKVGGERMHRLVRRGESVQAAPARVRVYSLEILDFRPPAVDFAVHCGSGTYVRAIARDVGEALGTGAHLSALRRTAIGSFRVEEAVSLAGLEDGKEPGSALLSPPAALRHLPAFRATAADAADVLHGRQISAPEDFRSDGCFAVVDPRGRLVAIAELQGDRIQPRKVFAA